MSHPFLFHRTTAIASDRRRSRGSQRITSPSGLCDSSLPHLKLLVRVVAYPKLNDNLVFGEPDPISRNTSLLSPPLNDNVKAEQDSFIKTCTIVEMAHLVYYDSAPHESDDNYYETKLSWGPATARNCLALVSPC